MEKLLAALRSAWAHVLVWKTWLQTWQWSLKVNGLHVVTASVALIALLTVVWWNGRLSVKHARSYAVSLLAEPAQPLLKPAAQAISATCEPKVIYKYVRPKVPKTFIENVFGP